MKVATKFNCDEIFEFTIEEIKKFLSSICKYKGKTRGRGKAYYILAKLYRN
jgi:hypothetical protein